MLGVCYYPEHWPENWWVEDGRRMRELGIAYVRLGATAPLLRYLNALFGSRRFQRSPGLRSSPNT